MGNSVTVGGVFPRGGLYELLDPQIPAREMGIREDPFRSPRIHGSDRLCCAICSLGGGFDPGDPVFSRASFGSGAHGHLLAVDSFTADRGH